MTYVDANGDEQPHARLQHIWCAIAARQGIPKKESQRAFDSQLDFKKDPRPFVQLQPLCSLVGDCLVELAP